MWTKRLTIGVATAALAAVLGPPDPPQTAVDVLVQLRGKPSDAELAAVPGLEVRRAFTVIPALAATLPRSSLPALRRAAWARRVDADAAVRAASSSARTSFGVAAAQLELPALDGDADGDRAVYSADDLVAAVLDTGIDAGHPDLDGGKVLAFVDCVGRPCATASPVDPDGHGTHVAATLAGAGDVDREYRGVAPGAALVGVRVLPPDADGVLSDVVAGIEWAVENRGAYGIEVLNLSLGSLDGSICSDGRDAASAAVNAAVAQGLVVVVAAGNEGPNPCTVSTPAAAADAITVAAMADAGLAPAKLGFFQAFISSRGPTADGRLKPDITAPGWSIISAAAGTSGYTAMTGTSMATPFVSGVALLLLEQRPGWSPAQVKSTLLETAEDWGRGGDNRTPGSRGHDIDYGAGRLDAYAALAAAGAPLASPPQVPVHDLFEGTLAGVGAFASYELDVTSTAFPIAATLIHPDFDPASPQQFDLRLRDPSGAQVATSETATRRQKRVRYAPPTTGRYTLDVVAAAGSGDFFVDVSAPSGTPPRNETLPQVVGTPQVGGRLELVPGTWTGRPAPRLVRSWLRCLPGTTSCTQVEGGAPTLDLAPADAGFTFRVRETARNGWGDASVDSAPTAVVVLPPNKPPVARAGPDVTVVLSGSRTATVALDGSLSGDPDGDALALTWLRDHTVVATGATATLQLGLGRHVFTLVADDGRTTDRDDVVVTVVDETPPTVEAEISGRLGREGWYTSDVAVRWRVVDAESDLTAPGCGETVVVVDTRGQTVTCSATSAGGSASRAVVVRRDATPPALAFAGNRGTYRVDETVAIACTVADETSGLAAAALCPSAHGAAYDFVGTTVLTASAADAAGNTASASTTFRVVVTVDGVCALVQRWVNRRGVAHALCQHLRKRAIGAFVNHVAAETGKRLLQHDAAVLTGLARRL